MNSFPAGKRWPVQIQYQCSQVCVRAFIPRVGGKGGDFHFHTELLHGAALSRRKPLSMRSPTTALIKGALYKGPNVSGLCSAEIPFLEVPGAEDPQAATLWQQKRLNLIREIK